MKTIEEAVDSLLQFVQHGDSERNRRIFYDWFIWQSLETKRTYEALGQKYEISNTRASQIVGAIARKLRNPNRKKYHADLCDVFDSMSSLVERNGYLLERNRFSQEIVREGLCSSPMLIEGITDLANQLNLQDHLLLEPLIVNNDHYLIHSTSLETIGKENIQKIDHKARSLAKSLGGVYPYQLLTNEKICQKIPKTYRESFVRILLEGHQDYISLGGGEFFGFKNEASRYKTHLQKVFFVYQDVSVDILTEAILRPIKKNIQGQKGNQRLLEALEQSKRVVDEYCLAMSFYSKSDEDNRFCQLVLEEPSGKMFSRELELYKKLRANGFPMSANKFVALMDDSDKSHFITFPILFYKKGSRKSSKYYTLDDRYDAQPLLTDDLETYKAEESPLLEGEKKQRLINYYERQPQLRSQAVQYHGVTCEVCGFNFEEVYGQLGSGYIEIHHLVPVSRLEGESAVDARRDMIAVCANCHRMFHRKRDDFLSPKDLQEMLAIKTFVVCIKPGESITPGKVYQMLQEDKDSDCVFIVNNDGKECLYSGDYFVSFDLPESQSKVLIDVLVR